MTRRPTYITLMSSRDGGRLLEETLKSLTLQTIPTEAISIVMDGGDVDSSIETLEKICKSTPHITIEHRGGEYARRDVRRMPENLNEAYRAAAKRQREVEFLFITGDDCQYPKHYAENLMRFMLRDEVAIASGLCTPTMVHPLREAYPTGSGRMVSHEYWRKIGASFPISYGWETWLIYRAEMDGEEVKVYPNLHFEHMHPRGRTHGFYNWGKARYLLGFHPLYMLGRTILDLLGIDSPIPRHATIKMLVGYVAAPILFKLKRDPYAQPLEDVGRFVREKQLKVIKKKLAIKLKRRITKKDD